MTLIDPRPVVVEDRPRADFDRHPHDPTRWRRSGAISAGWAPRIRVEGGVARQTSKYPPTPGYERGSDLDFAKGAARWCVAECPLVPGRLGEVHLRCLHCDVEARISTAGRGDDPVLVRLPCWWGRAKG